MKVNEKKVSKSFTNFEKALEFHNLLKNVKSRRQPCPGSCELLNVPNFHLFIEFKKSRKCSLHQLPTIIVIERTLRLAGLTTRKDNKYVVYCLLDGQWSLYDNNCTVIQTPSTVDIGLLCMIYILES
ncbi:uncharacterized protein LOC135164314 isoform X2 [Diachasmimorpha longicaudata]|uniref:uncharacterized protein LOC135164314 isoform X2 n=1 Tax=Diachasmimorpha longicaudata TaxID=58733 RepID=UPI0030B9029C